MALLLLPAPLMHPRLSILSPITPPIHAAAAAAAAVLVGSRVLPVAVGKASMVHLPLIGPILAALDPILVPRTPEERARLPPVLTQLVSKARAGVAPGDTRPRTQPVAIFPEGTTVNQRHVIAFQKGAFVPGVPVQPMAIRYPFCCLDVSIPPHIPNGVILLRQLTSLWCSLQVDYLPVYTPSAEEAADAGLFAEGVRATIASALGRTLAPHTDRDALLVEAARARHKALGPYAVAAVLPSLLTRDIEAAMRVPLRLTALAAFVDALHRCDAEGDGYLRREDLSVWVTHLLLPTLAGRRFAELLPRGGAKRGGVPARVRKARGLERGRSPSVAAASRRSSLEGTSSMTAAEAAALAAVEATERSGSGIGFGLASSSGSRKQHAASAAATMPLAGGSARGSRAGSTTAAAPALDVGSAGDIEMGGGGGSAAAAAKDWGAAGKGAGAIAGRARVVPAGSLLAAAASGAASGVQVVPYPGYADALFVALERARYARSDAAAAAGAGAAGSEGPSGPAGLAPADGSGAPRGSFLAGEAVGGASAAAPHTVSGDPRAAYMDADLSPIGPAAPLPGAAGDACLPGAAGLPTHGAVVVQNAFARVTATAAALAALPSPSDAAAAISGSALSPSLTPLRGLLSARDIVSALALVRHGAGVARDGVGRAHWAGAGASLPAPEKKRKGAAVAAGAADRAVKFADDAPGDRAPGLAALVSSSSSATSASGSGSTAAGAGASAAAGAGASAGEAFRLGGGAQSLSKLRAPGADADADASGGVDADTDASPAAQRTGLTPVSDVLSDEDDDDAGRSPVADEAAEGERDGDGDGDDAIGVVAGSGAAVLRAPSSTAPGPAALVLAAAAPSGAVIRPIAAPSASAASSAHVAPAAAAAPVALSTVCAAQLGLAVAVLSLEAGDRVDLSLVAALLERSAAEAEAAAAAAAASAAASAPGVAAAGAAGATTAGSAAKPGLPSGAALCAAAVGPFCAALAELLDSESPGGPSSAAGSSAGSGGAVAGAGAGARLPRFVVSYAQLEGWRQIAFGHFAASSSSGGGAAAAGNTGAAALVRGVVAGASELLWSSWGLSTAQLEGERHRGHGRGGGKGKTGRDQPASPKARK